MRRPPRLLALTRPPGVQIMLSKEENEAFSNLHSKGPAGHRVSSTRVHGGSVSCTIPRQREEGQRTWLPTRATRCFLNSPARVRSACARDVDPEALWPSPRKGLHLLAPGGLRYNGGPPLDGHHGSPHRLHLCTYEYYRVNVSTFNQRDREPRETGREFESDPRTRL